MAWDICKINLTKSSRSGKSTPSVGSGRSSPSVSGKLSPKNGPSKSRNSVSAPTSPLPPLEPVIIEGKVVELKQTENGEDKEKNDEIPKEVVTNMSEQSRNDRLEESEVRIAEKFTFEQDSQNKTVASVKLSEEMTTNKDSPSEDQRTYDIFRKTGVQNAEKSTSTDDDFPRLKKPAGIKVNQECQTDDLEKKAITVNKPKIEAKVTRSAINVKPAYSTALTRSVSAKAVQNVTKSKVESGKPVTNVRNISKFTPKPLITARTPTNSAKTGLARSKTVGDMKSTNVLKADTKLQKLPTNLRLGKKPLITKELPKKNTSNDCSSSVETLVNQGDNINVSNSSNSIWSSSETLNNDVKNDSMHSDGWLTVRNRSRKSSYSKPRKSDSSLSWATRFHQVSATASLPALALLPEANDGKLTNKSMDKTVKDNLNTFKSIKKQDLKSETVKNTSKTNFLKRSHTTLSKMTVNKHDSHSSMQEKHKTNTIIKKSSENNQKYIDLNKAKQNSDADSETDDENRNNLQDDLATEEEDQRKAMQLCEEEERLEQQIAQLRGMEIDVDTETDGTETEGDNDEQVDVLQVGNDNDAISLEARYEPMLAGKLLLRSVDETFFFNTLVSKK